MSALRALRRAARLLRTERSLWPLAALPFLLNALAFAVATAVLVSHLGALSAPLERWVHAGTWLGWLVRGVLVAGLALAVYATFTLVGGIVAAPFLDALSARVERLAGGVETPGPRGVGAVLLHSARCVREEAKRVAFFVGGQAGIFALGFVPGLAPFAAAAAVAFSALFLPLDYTGFALDRREVPFAARRRWVLAHFAPMLAFGGFGLALYAVPGLSFVCLPWLVSAGSLLVLELGPPPSPR